MLGDEDVDVLEWAGKAEIEQRVVYAHRSYSDIERGFFPVKEMTSALRAHNAGLVFLAQRRMASGYDYEATRISKPTAKMLGLYAGFTGEEPDKGWTEHELEILREDREGDIPYGQTAKKLGKSRYAVVKKAVSLHMGVS